MEAINLIAAFDRVTDTWSPKVIGQVNNQYIKLAKVKGELAWHKHDEEDEFFQVIKGRLVLQFEEGREVILNPGEIYIVPKGVMHNPVAEEECWFMLIETVTTKHTGDLVMERTRSVADQLA
jgi:quercetin dioxygenase-like cupin family protein